MPFDKFTNPNNLQMSDATRQLLLTLPETTVPTDVATKKAFQSSALDLLSNTSAVVGDIMNPSGQQGIMHNVADYLDQIKANVNYKSNIDTDGIANSFSKGNILEGLGKVKATDIPELLGQSAPYMIALSNPYTATALVGATARDLGEKRADAEGVPYYPELGLRQLPAALAITALDRIGLSAATRIMKGGLVQRLASTPGSMVTAALTEASTEAAQQGIEELSTKVGTREEMPMNELFGSMGSAGVLGGLSGGAMRVGHQAYDTARYAVSKEHRIDEINNAIGTGELASAPVDERSKALDEAFGKFTIDAGVASIVDGKEYMEFYFEPETREDGKQVWGKVTNAETGQQLDITQPTPYNERLQNRILAEIDSLSTQEEISNYKDKIKASDEGHISNYINNQLLKLQKLTVDNQEVLGSEYTEGSTFNISRITEIKKKAMLGDETVLWNDILANISTVMPGSKSETKAKLRSMLEAVKEDRGSPKAKAVVETWEAESKLALGSFIARFPNSKQANVAKEMMATLFGQTVTDKDGAQFVSSLKPASETAIKEPKIPKTTQSTPNKPIVETKPILSQEEVDKGSIVIPVEVKAESNKVDARKQWFKEKFESFMPDTKSWQDNFFKLITKALKAEHNNDMATVNKVKDNYTKDFEDTKNLFKTDGVTDENKVYSGILKGINNIRYAKQLPFHDEEFLDELRNGYDDSILDAIIEFNGTYRSDFIDTVGKAYLASIGHKSITKEDNELYEYGVDGLDPEFLDKKTRRDITHAGLAIFSIMKENGLVEDKLFKNKSGSQVPMIRMTDKLVGVATKLKEELKADNVNDVNSPMLVSNTTQKDKDNVDQFQKGSQKVKIPEIVAKAMRIMQNEEFSFNQDMSKIIDGLTDQKVIDMLLGVEDTKASHPIFEKIINSKNHNERLKFSRIKEFMEESGEGKFWFKFQDNINVRFQPYATVANPVADKVVARWIVDGEPMSIARDDKTGNYAFKYSIAHAFGEHLKMLLADGKKFSHDKDNGIRAMEAYSKIENAYNGISEFAELNNAFKYYRKGKVDKAVAELAKAGLGFHAIRAMVEMTKYQQFLAGKEKSFKSAMPMEMDGITNGLSMLMGQVGNGTLAETSPMLNKTGMYTKDSKFKNIYDLRESGEPDLYTEVKDIIESTLKEHPLRVVFEAIDIYTRDVAKSPVMIYLYNAGELGIELKVGQTAHTNLMNAIHNKKLKHEDIIKLIDTMALYYSESKNKLTATNKNMLKSYLLNESGSNNYKAESILVKYFAEVIGHEVTSAMNAKFAKANVYKHAFKRSSEIFNRVFELMYKEDKPRAIKNIPLYKGYNSETGVQLFATGKEASTDEKYSIAGISKDEHGNVKVRQAASTPSKLKIENNFKPASLNEGGYTITGTKRGFVVLTHMLDSTILAETIVELHKRHGFVKGFPIFDAFSGNSQIMKEFADIYNEKFIEVHSKYSFVDTAITALKELKNNKFSSEFFGNKLYSDEVYTDMDKHADSNEDFISPDNITIGEAIDSMLNSFEILKVEVDKYRKEFRENIDPSLTTQMSGADFRENSINGVNKEIGSEANNFTKEGEAEVTTVTNNKEILELADKLTPFGEIQDSTEHKSHLVNLLGSISNALGSNKEQVTTKVSVRQADRNQGEYETRTQNVNINVGKNGNSDKSILEIYTHELLHKVTELASTFDNKAKVEMDHVMALFRNYIANNPGSIDNSMYEYIAFNRKEFIAHAGTNKEVRDILSKIPYIKREGTTLIDKVNSIIAKAISLLDSLVRGNNKSIPKNRLEEVDNIIKDIMITNKKIQSAAKENAFGHFYEAVSKLDKSLGTKLVKSVNAVKNSKVGDLVENIGKLQATRRIAKIKIVEGLVKELTGFNKDEDALLDLTKLSTNTQRHYNSMRDDTKKKIDALLSNTDKRTKTALKETLLDLDMLSLTDNTSELSEYLLSKTKASAEAKDIEAKIMSFAKSDKQKNFARYIINQSRGLGYYLATYDNKLSGAQLLNAQSIINIALLDKNKVVKLTVGNEELKILVDKLATLHGVTHTDSATKKIAGTYMTSNQDSVNEVLTWQRATAVRANKLLFDVRGENHLRIKGYTASSTQGMNDFEFIPLSDLPKYIKNYYQLVKIIRPTDTNISGQNQMALVKRIDVDKGYEQGIISIQSPGSKGIKLQKIGLKTDEVDMSLKADSLYSDLINLNVMKGGQMIPLLNPVNPNHIVNLRYSMNKTNRKGILNELSDISSVMANTFSMSERKIDEKYDNEKIVDAIFEDYLANKDSVKFVTVEQKTEYEAQWAMLPRETKKYIYGKYHVKSLPIRANMVDEFFGYNNYELSSNKFVIRFAEKLWKDLISIAKEHVVIKTPSVVMGNIFSNIRTVAKFMPIDKAIKRMYDGWLLMDKYRKDYSRLKEIEVRIAAKMPFNKAEYTSLRKEIADNLVTPLVEAGQFQAVVDDTDLQLQDSSNIINNWFSSKLDHANPKAKAIIETAYLSRSTSIHKSISKFILYSDFISRFAIYEELKDKASEKEVLDLTKKLFVDYAVVQERHIKWFADIGIFMFPKYTLRIQRAILNMFKTKPSQELGDAVLQKLTFNAPDIADSLITNVGAGRFGVMGLDGIASPHIVPFL